MCPACTYGGRGARAGGVDSSAGPVQQGGLRRRRTARLRRGSHQPRQHRGGAVQRGARPGAQPRALRGRGAAPRGAPGAKYAVAGNCEAVRARQPCVCAGCGSPGPLPGLRLQGAELLRHGCCCFWLPYMDACMQFLCSSECSIISSSMGTASRKCCAGSLYQPGTRHSPCRCHAGDRGAVCGGLAVAHRHVGAGGAAAAGARPDGDADGLLARRRAPADGVTRPDARAVPATDGQRGCRRAFSLLGCRVRPGLSGRWPAAATKLGMGRGRPCGACVQFPRAPDSIAAVLTPLCMRTQAPASHPSRW